MKLISHNPYDAQHWIRCTDDEDIKEWACHDAYEEGKKAQLKSCIEQIKAKREEIMDIIWTKKPEYATDQIIALFEEKQVRRCPLCDEDYTPALQYEVCPHHKLTSLTEGGK